MKKIAYLLILIVILCFTGCTTLQYDEESVDENIAEITLDDDIFDSAQADVITDKWPSDMLPDVVPEYTVGSIVGYSGLQSSLSITVSNTTEEDVDNYHQALRDSAFALDKNFVATKDDIEISIDYFEESQSAIISVTYTDVESWPAEMIMDIPALDYGVISYLDISKENYIFMQVKYLSHEHINEWYSQLEDEGFVKTAHGYTRNDAELVISDYNHGNWDIEIIMQQQQ